MTAFAKESRLHENLERMYLNDGWRKTEAVFRRPSTDANRDPELFTITVPVSVKPDKDDKFFRPKHLKDELHVIARGTYADIIAAKMVRGPPDQADMAVAIRRYWLTRLAGTVDGYRRVKREIDITRLQRHENIVRCIETWTEPHEAETGPLYHCIASERMDHTLEKYFEHLGKKDLSDQPVKRDIRHLGALLTQILHAIEFLHNTGIIHRDITPRNIGMNQKEFVIKLLDFGLARDILPNNDYTINVDTPPIYKAPEALVQEMYDTGVDIWATALVAIEMLGLKLMMPPQSSKCASVDLVLDRMRDVFSGQKIEELSIVWRNKTGQSDMKGAPTPNQKLQDIFVTLEPRIGDNIGPLTKTDLYDLLSQMLEVDRLQRQPASKLLKHPFLHILDRKLRERGKKAKDCSLETENKSARAVLLNPGTFRRNTAAEA